MSASPGGADLPDSLVARSYDAGSLRRGRQYALERRVRLLSSPPGSLKGVVKGSGRNTYLTEVHWYPPTRPASLDDSCTCPLGGACKHCVALILTARQGSAGPAPAPVASWRRALARLAQEDGTAYPAGDPMALQWSFRTPPRTRYGAQPPPVVTVRPLRMGAKGRWVKTGASWRDIGSPAAYSYSSGATRRELDAAHRSVLKAMLTSLGGSGYYYETGPIDLGRFGPDLWHHLDRALESGIELVGGEGAEGGVLVAAEPAVVAVDLRAGDGGAVAVETRLVLDGEPLGLAAEDSGPIGSPPHGIFIGRGGQLRLVPLAAPLHSDLVPLVGGEPLVVPAEDVDEFIEDYQPALARLAAVGSSDGSVAIEASQLVGMVLSVERTALDEASLTWGLRYRRGRREWVAGLYAVGGRGRDRAAERKLIEALALPVDLMPELVGPAGTPSSVALRGRAVVKLFSQVLPWLEERGQVSVEITGDLPELREATEDPLISLSVGDPGAEGRGGTDWFDLSVDVTVGGEQVDFAHLFTALSTGEEVMILPSGAWLRLDRPELTRLRDLIGEAQGLADHPGGAVARVNQFQVSWWEELAALGVVDKQSDRWAESVARMRDLAVPERVAPPPGLEATLRSYQQEGLDWLGFLHRNRLGGILADDMGLGKTVQALALFLHVLDQAPEARFLVVAPTSVVENWHREAGHFAPGLGVATIRATAARRGTSLAEAVGDARLVVTSYALFRIEFDAYEEMGWEVLVLDEAQFVKNHTGKTYQCVRRLDAAMKIAVTGTPLENSLMDLWSLLSITAPGLYPDPKRFTEVYRRPIESGGAPEVLATLRRRIAPLMRRRTKAEVLSDLPPKTEQTVEVELSGRHARIYQTQLQRERQKVLGLVGDVQRNRFEILKSLTVLRQLSLDPGLVDAKHDNVGSAKIERLLEDLEQVVAEGHRALVFSQFTRYLSRVRKRLDAAGIAHSYLDGRTRKREEAISAFKDGGVPVFVISLKAGGFGLNLTEADYCFVLDPWWNPAVETQAVDRTHRIGQVNPVMVYRYVSAGTIEEKVMELKARKAALFASVMEADGALSGALSADDIRGLLELT